MSSLYWGLPAVQQATTKFHMGDLHLESLGSKNCSASANCSGMRHLSSVTCAQIFQDGALQGIGKGTHFAVGRKKAPVKCFGPFLPKNSQEAISRALVKHRSPRVPLDLQKHPRYRDRLEPLCLKQALCIVTLPCTELALDYIAGMMISCQERLKYCIPIALPFD